MLSNKDNSSSFNFRQLRNQAKEMLAAQKQGELPVIERIKEYHPYYSQFPIDELSRTELKLSDVQLVLARELGFQSWPKLKAYIESSSSPIKQDITSQTEKEAIEALIKLGAYCKRNAQGHLKTLGFTGKQNKFTDEHLDNLSVFPHLTFLHIGSTEMTDKGLRNLKYLRNLESLHLIKIPITDEGLENVSSLTKLKAIALGRTNISDEGLKYLQSLSNLEEVYLNNTQISDRGIEHLVNLKHLKKLYLNRTKVTDSGLNVMKNFPLLEEIGLYDLAITDKGLDHLSHLENLKKIYLSKTQISEAGLKRIKENTQAKVKR